MYLFSLFIGVPLVFIRLPAKFDIGLGTVTINNKTKLGNSNITWINIL